MTATFLVGLIGSLILVVGAAWPENESPRHPLRSIKNWLFALGGLIMLVYAVLGYGQGGPIFFVFLEILVLIASTLMMIDVDDRIDLAVISVTGVGFILWSLTLFEGYNTIFFILGLSGIGLGYAFQMGTVRRELALFLGSLLIAIFSFIEMNTVFFWLNVFFAAFSAVYLVKSLARLKKQKKKR
ncbi:hypothetical protein HZA43_04495 [Candidatus Peregrinibacteria bacterium]|nr:hypothetical protein [Candidatus Peregrinibacteria bacterium]